jgi:hypothetical protein
METINLEPHWPSLWRFIQCMKKTDLKAYNKFIKTLGADQLELIELKAKE